MSVSKVQFFINQNTPRTYVGDKNDFVISNNPEFQGLHRRSQEDNFNNKGINKKHIFTYATVGLGLATLIGAAIDFKVAGGKHIRKIWNKLTENINFFKAKSPLERCIKECKGLTFDTPDLKLMKDFYGDKNKYDLGLRYAIVAYNTKKLKGSGAIIREIPEMFKGLNKDELIKTLDNLRLQNVPYEAGEFYQFTIGGKSFKVSYLGEGSANKVYKITDSSGKSLCYRYSKYPLTSCMGHGIFDETAITIEANKAGVTDVNKLYMANVLSEKFTTDTDRVVYSGGWQLVDFIDNTTVLPEKGLKLLDWLKSKGLYHSDIENRRFNMVNGFIVDLGGIRPSVNDDPYEHFVHINWKDLSKYIEI